MGILSGLKKALKGIAKGIKKVFKAVGKAVGKLMGSKLGKILMVALAVVTGGAALAAGWGAATAPALSSSGFVAKFMAGGKAFLSALAHPIKAMKGLASGGAQGAAQAVGRLPGAGGAAANAAAQAAKTTTSVAPSELLAHGGVGPPVPAGSTASGIGGASTTVPVGASRAAAKAAGAAVPPAPKGMLSRAAGSVGGFLKTPGGGLFAGNVLSGVGEGAMMDKQYSRQNARERDLENRWKDPSLIGDLRAAVNDVTVPGGYLSRAARVSDFLNNRDYQYPQPTTVQDPYTVAGYARGEG